ncbi:hypothetical protein Goshw_025883 [Gossypium schwendimanii]|uniref:DUF4283 domain-containing protein n=1 Tax=Gossypium schwendimanii TaxID=34291 RepID=A0A7J9MK12_GOSSC|nr:hypothetical protein [Gossypium schwendimanii]
MEDELANMHLANEDEEAFHEDSKVSDDDFYFSWVIEGMPWFFNNHLLLPYNLQSGEDPVQLPLNNAIFWIQIHEFPPQFMRIKVRLDVRLALKRKKKVLLEIRQGKVQWELVVGCENQMEREVKPCIRKGNLHGVIMWIYQEILILFPISKSVSLMGILSGTHGNTKIGVGPKGVESNVAGFMELGSDDKDSPI